MVWDSVKPLGVTVVVLQWQQLCQCSNITDSVSVEALGHIRGRGIRSNPLPLIRPDPLPLIRPAPLPLIRPDTLPLIRPDPYLL